MPSRRSSGPSTSTRDGGHPPGHRQLFAEYIRNHVEQGLVRDFKTNLQERSARRWATSGVPHHIDRARPRQALRGQGLPGRRAARRRQRALQEGGGAGSCPEALAEIQSREGQGAKKERAGPDARTARGGGHPARPGERGGRPRDPLGRGSQHEERHAGHPPHRRRRDLEDPLTGATVTAVDRRASTSSSTSTPSWLSSSTSGCPASLSRALQCRVRESHPRRVRSRRRGPAPVRRPADVRRDVRDHEGEDGEVKELRRLGSTPSRTSSPGSTSRGSSPSTR